jgi:hypothetical protein
VKALSRWLVVVALIFSIGVHWALLQSLAWGGMLITYTQESGFARGISMTFDGDHPCKLCKAIAAAKPTEPKKERQVRQASPELKLALPPTGFQFRHPPYPVPGEFLRVTGATWDPPPELPPPRLI